MSTYRHILTRHERVMFDHVNPDIRPWRRGKLLEEVFVDANRRGADAFVVFLNLIGIINL